MNTNIKVIPHKKQRYDTVGDWFYNANSTLQIRVSEMSDAKYEHLVAVHECVEAVLCDFAGITETDVDDWDFKYHGDGEPGDDLNCPYRRQHIIATKVERIVANELGVDWEEYDREIASLQWKK